MRFVICGSYFHLGIYWKTGRFTAEERNPLPIVQEDCWSPGPFLTFAVNLAFTGTRAPACRICFHKGVERKCCVMGVLREGTIVSVLFSNVHSC